MKPQFDFLLTTFVLLELAESSSAMLDTRVIAMLDKYNDVIEYIHISDQFTGPQQEGEQQTKPETKRMLIVSFTLKGATDADMEELKPFVATSHLFNW